MFKRNVEQSFPRDLDLKITVKTSVSCGEVNHLQMVDFLFSNFFQVEGDVPGQKKKGRAKKPVGDVPCFGFWFFTNQKSMALIWIHENPAIEAAEIYPTRPKCHIANAISDHQAMMNA